MKLKPIITSLLETDSYKLSMGQAIFHQFPTYKTTWSFKCRNKNVKFTPEMLKEIEDQIDSYCKLKFNESELKWLTKNLPWIKEDYIAFLRFWHPRREEIHVNEMLQQGMDDSGLAIDCTGTWLNTSMYEIALLAIVNEVYFAFKYGPGAKDIEFQKRTMEKFAKLQNGEYDIGDAFASLKNGIENNCIDLTGVCKTNMPARLRMTALYGIAQCLGGVMVNTCNRSESVLGNDTLFGDDCGSYGPIQKLTKTEVKAIAAWLGVPENLVNKTPIDGLQPLSDEDRLGITYAKVDDYIRSAGPVSTTEESLILDKFIKNKFKMEIVRVPGPDFAHYPDKIRANFGV